MSCCSTPCASPWARGPRTHTAELDAHSSRPSEGARGRRGLSSSCRTRHGTTRHTAASTSE
eukprot:1979705-Lingulodinium_polyedra.AAC.1